MAIDFLLGELRHEGVLGPAMARLPHYFTPFQAFIVQESENDRLRFDLRVGLGILWRGAEYRAADPTRPGLFLYQFEVLCRNRLGYDRGLDAIARDPAFTGIWRDWIMKLRRQIGMVDIADVIYVHSEYYWQRQRGNSSAPEPLSGRDPEQSTSDMEASILFGEREGPRGRPRPKQ